MQVIVFILCRRALKHVINSRARPQARGKTWSRRPETCKENAKHIMHDPHGMEAGLRHTVIARLTRQCPEHWRIARTAVASDVTRRLSSLHTLIQRILVRNIAMHRAIHHFNRLRCCGGVLLSSEAFALHTHVHRILKPRCLPDVIVIPVLSRLLHRRTVHTKMQTAPGGRPGRRLRRAGLPAEGGLLHCPGARSLP